MSLRSLLHDLRDLLSEGRRPEPPGTIKTWGDFEYEKQRNGKWRKLPKAERKPGVKARKKLGRASGRLQGKLPLHIVSPLEPGEGEAIQARLESLEAKDPSKYKLPEGKTFDEHLEEMRTLLYEHQQTLKAKMNKLWTAASKAGIRGQVKGRVKALGSAMEKLTRYWVDDNNRATRAEDIPDLSAVRLVIKDLRDIPNVVEKLREQWGKEIWNADYVNNPRNGYRSYHLTTRDDKGKEFEIQVRTENQDKWAEYSHAVKYKPVRGGDRDAQREKNDEIDRYLLELSAYLHAKDVPGAPEVPKPDCPDVIKETVGCFKE